jgi:hypothetical protein
MNILANKKDEEKDERGTMRFVLKDVLKAEV